MTDRIIQVTISVNARREYFGGVHVRRVPKSPARLTSDTRTYPLTERNYWRAVGLQLRLVGFADDPEPWPLDKANYKEGE